MCYEGIKRSVGDEDIAELVRLCLELEPLSDERQEQYREAAGRGYTGTDDITDPVPARERSFLPDPCTNDG